MTRFRWTVLASLLINLTLSSMAQSTGSYDFEKDIAELTEAIQNNPTDDAFAIRGVAFYRMGQLLKAQADFDRAIELKPDFDYYYYWRGSVFFARGQYDDASAAFRRATATSTCCAMR